jgi:shikimate dehydrogenase
MIALDGETRLHLILGDPIAQVKSPGGVTRSFAARGANAAMLPAHVVAEEFDDFLRGVGAARNLDGLTITVPHKFAAAAHCATLTERARLLGAVNVMRRNADRSWHGDMLDGAAMVAAIRAAGGELSGQHALLVGAGGAGTAIAQALLQAGVASLALHDADAARTEALLGRLQPVAGGTRLRALTAAEPEGCTLVVNATPAGMRPDDPIPVPAARLRAQMFVADVITAPEVTPLLAAARALGCGTSTGLDMFAAQVDLIADFLLGGG